jgi:hydrogenase maturation protease
MKRILVIGYGNPYRADDGVGYRAAMEYFARNSDRGNVHVIAAETLKPDVVEAMAEANLVVFVDGNNCHGEPGCIWQQEVLPDDKVDGVFAHPLTPAIALQACKVIYRRRPDAVQLCLKGENYGFGSRVSPVVEAALPKLMTRLDDIILPALDREVYAGAV